MEGACATGMPADSISASTRSSRFLRVDQLDLPLPPGRARLVVLPGPRGGDLRPRTPSASRTPSPSSSRTVPRSSARSPPGPVAWPGERRGPPLQLLADLRPGRRSRTSPGCPSLPGLRCDPVSSPTPTPSERDARRASARSAVRGSRPRAVDLGPPTSRTPAPPSGRAARRPGGVVLALHLAVRAGHRPFSSSDGGVRRRRPIMSTAFVGSVPRRNHPIWRMKPIGHLKRFDDLGVTVRDLDHATKSLRPASASGRGPHLRRGRLHRRSSASRLPHGSSCSPTGGGSLIELSSFVRPDPLPLSPAAEANEPGCAASPSRSMTSGLVDRLAEDGYGLVGGSVSTRVSGGWRTSAAGGHPRRPRRADRLTPGSLLGDARRTRLEYDAGPSKRRLFGVPRDTHVHVMDLTAGVANPMRTSLHVCRIGCAPEQQPHRLRSSAALPWRGVA